MGNDVDPAQIEAILNRLVSPLTGEAQPNLSALRLALRDIDVLRLNVKMNGYALARKLAAELPPLDAGEPSMMALLSKPSTQSDLESVWARHWLARLGLPLVFHRKLWEYTYVLQALWQSGNLIPGKRGLGFGCGTEPLPSLFAANGISAVVTDLASEQQNSEGWTATSQHTHSADAVFYPSLVDRSAFDAHIVHRFVDMRQIPKDLEAFDFCWSICALEHLGSIQEGLSFMKRSLDTLRPGGIAVHTTEFNFLSEDSTIDNWPTVLFLRKHFETLATELAQMGHMIAPLDFDVGDKPLDLFIDVPPYQGDWSAYQTRIWPPAAHLKLSIDGIPSTCFGLIVTKAS